MENTIIGELYFAFSKGEVKKLNKYLTTSNWRNSEFVIKSHEYFLEIKKKNLWKAANKSELYQYVYGDNFYKDSKLRFTLNRLHKAIREYKLIEAVNEDSIFAKKIWMDYVRSRTLKKNMTYSQNEDMSIKDSEYRYLYKYFKNQETSMMEFSFSKSIEKQYQSIKDVMYGAGAFSDLVFLKNYCSLITFSSVYKSLPVEFPEERLRQIRGRNYGAKLPEFKVYISLVDLLSKMDSDSYLEYKKNVFEHLEIWSDKELMNLLTYLVNYTAIKINEGDSNFENELYDLFVLFEEKDMYRIEGHINQSRINNIINSFLKKEQYVRSYEFLEKYISYVKLSNRDTCFHFNMAKIYFEQKDYKKSLRELLLVDFSKNAFYSLNAKVLLLKNYYELEETEGFNSLISSFKEYIRKNKVISEAYKKSYMNFIKFSKKIYLQTPSKLKKAKLDLENLQYLTERNWLNVKIDERLSR